MRRISIIRGTKVVIHNQTTIKILCMHTLTLENLKLQSIFSDVVRVCNTGALHTGTETEFTGFESPIRIQCGVDVARAYILRALHCWTGTHTLCYAHNTQPGSGSRSCGGKVVFESRFPICVGFGSKVPCGETQWSNEKELNPGVANGRILCFC